MPAITVIKHRRDTAANWVTANPILAAGEIGVETDTNKFKFGNGTAAWNDVDYASASGGTVVSETPPADPTEGLIWFSSSDAKSFIYYDLAWVELSPAIAGPQGPVGPQGPIGPAGPAGETYPVQTGNNGEFLVTNGSTVSWSNTATANTAATPAIVAKGAASQTANLQEWQNSSGTILSRIGSTGSFVVGNSIIGSGGVSSLSINSTSTVTATNGFIGPVASSVSISAAQSASHVGYVGMPQQPFSSSKTINAQYAGKHIYTDTTGVTHTIDGTEASEIGTTYVFVNAPGVTITISLSSGTLILAGAGTTGNRTLGPNGMATALKVTSTSWIISGNGLS